MCLHGYHHNGFMATPAFWTQKTRTGTLEYVSSMMHDTLGKHESYMGIFLEVGRIDISPSILGYCVEGSTVHW